MGRTDPARQLPLPLAHSAARPLTLVTPAEPSARDNEAHPLALRLTLALGAPLTVTVTDNRRTMLSIRRVAGVRNVRLHHMFLDAPEEVVAAVARYLAHGDRRAGAQIDRYIRDNGHHIRAGEAPDAGAREARGEVHDLQEVLDEVVARYCPDAAPVAITWGRSGASQRGRARSRTIRLGTYLYDARVIRIHRALDRAWVPRYFVAWVVFHELLHHVTPAPVRGGRQCHHGPEFRAREAAFHDRERAMEWERRNVRRLIASRDD